MYQIEKFSRKVHPIISPILLIQLTISVSTGFLVMIYDKVLNQPFPKILMMIHQGRIEFIPYSRSIFTFLYWMIINCSVIIAIPLMKKIWKKEFWRMRTIKSIHSFVSSILFLFYISMSFTGMLYRNLREIFEFENKKVSWILDIHAMRYSEYLQICYITFITFFTFILMITGIIQWIQWIKNKF